MMHLFLSILSGIVGGVIGVYLLFKIADWQDRRKE